MRHSAKIDKIAAALRIVQQRVTPIVRDARNEDTATGYSSIVALTDALRGPLADNGLSYSQDAPLVQVGPLFAVNAVTLLMHESGQWIEGETQLIFVPGSTMQSAAAVTFAKRVGLGSITGTVSEKDQDAQGQPEPEPVFETRYTSILKAERAKGIGAYFKQVFIADEQRFVCKDATVAAKILPTIGQHGVMLSLKGYADGDVEILDVGHPSAVIQ